MTDITRRQFLRGDFSGRTAPAPRPPWAREEPAFRSACTRCGDCVNACPQHLLALDGDGRPTVDFSRNACTFCGECVTACRPGALKREEGAAPWLRKASIGTRCLAQSGVVCRACGDACPSQAIRFAPRIMAAAVPQVDASLCTGCGACVRPCPAQAVTIA